MKIVSYNYRKKKNSFPNKEFFMLVWKTNFWYLCEKVKAFHLRCVLNTALLFFLLAIFHVSKSLILKHFYFSVFVIFFSILNQPLFFIFCESFVLFVPYCGFLFFSSKKKWFKAFYDITTINFCIGFINDKMMIL